MTVKVTQRSSKGRRVEFTLRPENLRLVGHMEKLEVIHKGFSEAAQRVESVTGVPLCVENCGLCCSTASVIVNGVEAEYVATWLLGHSEHLGKVLDACRDWLTRPGDYTYGEKITPELFKDHIDAEFSRIGQSEQCPFLQSDMRCLIHDARPLVCRAYSVTHAPNPWCRRPWGAGEEDGTRVYWDGHAKEIPLYDWWETLKSEMQDTRFLRQGFLYTMLFERFRAKELADLLYDGKIPLAKVVVGFGAGPMLLWQEQLDEAWGYGPAEASIGVQVPLKQVDGQWIMKLGDELPKGVRL